MPTRYIDRLSDPSVRTITNSGGSQNGPPGGDGWQLVQNIPNLPAGRLALFVTMHVGNVQRFGAAPNNGIVQLCMGRGAIRSSIHYWSFPCADAGQLNALEGKRVSFLLIFDDAFAEPEFATGATFPGGDMGVYARFFWNGDPTAYTVNFDVSMVEATWMLLEDMDAADRHVWQTSTPANVPNPAIPIVYQRYTDTWAALDETWLTFFVAYFTPSVNPNTVVDQTAMFAFYDATGVATPSSGIAAGDWILGGGTSGQIPGPVRWASDQNTAPLRWDNFGFMDVRQFDSGARTLNVMWSQWSGNGAHPAIVQHQRLVSIRLDVLAPLLLRNDEQIDDIVEYRSNLQITSREIALEVGPQQLTFEPYVFGSLEMLHQSPTPEQMSLYLRDSTGEVFVDPTTYQKGAINTTQQNMMFSSNGIGFGDPQFRYEMIPIKLTIPVGVHQNVRNVSMCVVHPVRDPDGQAPTLPSVGDPVPVVPGAEGPSSAADLTHPPNATLEDTPEIAQQRFEGHTAYVRTWSTWLKARRGFSLFWEPLTLAQRDVVAAEVAPGQLFQWEAPGGEVVVCCAVERPTITGLGANTWRVQVQAVELVYTL